jgi:translation initiation factor IF-2
MKLAELAKAHNLALELLTEVVEVDLKIKLPKGADSELKEAEVARILSCDGLETTDGKEFTPIIAKEFEEKHKKKQQAKKGLETRKKKAEEEAAKAKADEERKLVEERKKHAEELARRQAEDDARRQAEAVSEQRRLDEDERIRVDLERQRIVAEDELRRRESEAKRISEQLSAMKQSQAAARAAETPPAAPVQPAALPPATPVAPSAAPVVAETPAASAPITVSESAPAPESETSGDLKPTPEPPRAGALAPKAPVVPPKAALPPPVMKSVAGVGSKLANMAKQTQQKGDHSLKAIVPKPATPAPGAAPAPGSDQPLSPEDRRRLIQANIQRNLEMAKRVAEAKQAAKRPGFRTIDRTKTPGGPPGRGPGGPGRGPGGPPRGPGGPARGPVRGGRAAPGVKGKTDEAAEQEGNLTRRRLRSSLDEDISGVTEFSIAVPCTVREFSEASGVRVSVIIAKLFMAGVMANINSVLGKSEVELLAQEFKKTVTVTEPLDLDEQIQAETQTITVDKPEDLAPRPPVVVIMGHVDHGKTSLLDSIRKSEIAAGEAGGITQHIGAYTVTAPNGMEVTFIDTPGHQAFTEMRARGAKATDVAVIVVDAVDGCMPQTIEAINHAKAAGVTVVVAMNKCDKPEATPQAQERVVRQLAEQGLQAEEWGGEIGVIRTSALTGLGIDELLARLALETDVKELKANHFAPASGIVLEAHRHEGQGVTATFLVQRGSLAIGDAVLAGTAYGRARSLTNWKGERTELAGPSQAVEIIGLDELPRAGDGFRVMEDIPKAAEAAEVRRQKQRERELLAKSKNITSSSILGDIAESKKKELRVVVKADAAGSLEVLQKTINDLTSQDVRVSIIHSAVGGINSSDVTLAVASRATVIGFHVIADSKARMIADDNGIDIRSYTIIYELLDELKLAAAGMLEPETRENVIGHAEVKATFQISKTGVVAGLKVTDGIVRRDAFMRITRDSNILHTGKVGSLRRFKEDVKEVREGFECGLTVENFSNIATGDVMEFYLKEKVPRKVAVG